MAKKNNKIPFDGFARVIEMLIYADNDFREKILRGIAQRDRALAERLLAATNRAINEENRRQTNNNYGGRTQSTSLN